MNDTGKQDPTIPIIDRIAFIGNYLPRQCGIATFTTNLCEAIASECGHTMCIALPVNDTEVGYNDPHRVRFELTEIDIDSYRRAADFLNISNVDVVSLQHEYGVFGGRAGSNILEQQSGRKRHERSLLLGRLNRWSTVASAGAYREGTH